MIKAPDPPLSDGVVTLRPAAEGDLPSIEAGLRDPDIVRWFGQADSSATDVLSLNERRWAEGSPTMAICEADGACLVPAWGSSG